MAHGEQDSDVSSAMLITGSHLQLYHSVAAQY
jgi:hypothetical protein